MDFTLSKYETLCASLKEFGYNFYNIRDYIETDVKEPFVILRHDVDRSPLKAHLIAKIENKLGISSTYNFRTISKKLFDLVRMQEIQNLGHEIGYHYEVLVKAKGDVDKALVLFAKEINTFRENSIDIKTATFHGSPHSSLDSRNIWNNSNFSDFGLVGLGYDSIDCSDIFYLTDTGRTFAQTSANVRDRPRGKFLINSDIKGTKDIIQFAGAKLENLYIVTHPVRWSKGYSDWAWEYLFQNTKNIGKSFLSHIYKSK